MANTCIFSRMNPFYTEPISRAAHEAGHAIMAVACGGGVRLLDNEPVLFAARGEQADGFCYVVGNFDVEKRLLVDVAGHIAAAIWNGATTCPDWRETIGCALKATRNGSGKRLESDELSVVRFIFEFMPDATDEDCKFIYQVHCQKAFETFRRNDVWSALRAVAVALCEKGQLTGPEFYTVLKASGWPCK